MRRNVVIYQVVITPSTIVPCGEFVMAFHISLLFVRTSGIAKENGPFNPNRAFVPITRIATRRPDAPITKTKEGINFRGYLLNVTCPTIFFFHVVHPGITRIFRRIRTINDGFVNVFSGLYVVTREFFYVSLNGRNAYRQFNGCTLI